MMALEEFLKLLPEDKRKDVVIVRASDPVPELKGKKLPRIVDYDMMETSESTWKLWERIKATLKSKKKMIFEVYYNEAVSNIRVTLFEIEIYNRLEDGMWLTKIDSHPNLENLLTYFHKRWDGDGFDKESFVRDSGYMNRIYSEIFPLIERKAPFNQILDRLERIINRYAEKYGLEVNVD